MPALGALLGYAGLIPFVVTAVGLWFQADAWLLHAGLLYGAVIVSFLGGIHWGLALAGPGQAGSRDMLAFSVVPSLIGWVGVLVGGLTGALILGAAFVLVWLFEQRAAVRERLPAWFRQLRRVLTLVVVSCHLSYAVWAAVRLY